jgi:hypothetical protein
VVSPGGVTLPRALECARIALGSTHTRTVQIPDDPAHSRAGADAIIEHRLSRLALDNAEAQSLQPGDLERVTTDALAHTHAAFQLVGHTATVVSVLEQTGIRFLIIKGIALAALTATPASRGAGDVDVLVDPLDVPRVHKVLLDNGFRPVLALPDFAAPARWRVWQFLDREASYLGPGSHLDLHWRISSQRHLFPDFETLYSRRTTVTVADTALPTLSVPDSLAASCFHTYFDQFQPARSLIDVVAALKSLGQENLPPYSRALRKLLSGVIHLVAEVFPGVVDEEVARLAKALPRPPHIVGRRFARALVTPRVRWEDHQDPGALWGKAWAEAAFDHPLEFVPRFVGKRLFDFPTWTASRPSTPLGKAFILRVGTEKRRAKTAL